MKLLNNVIKFLEVFYDEKKYNELIKLVFIIFYLFPISNFKNNIDKSKLKLLQFNTNIFYEKLVYILKKYEKRIKYKNYKNFKFNELRVYVNNLINFFNNKIGIKKSKLNNFLINNFLNYTKKYSNLQHGGKLLSQPSYVKGTGSSGNLGTLVTNIGCTVFAGVESIVQAGKVVLELIEFPSNMGTAFSSSSAPNPDNISID